MKKVNVVYKGLLHNSLRDIFASNGPPFMDLKFIDEGMTPEEEIALVKEADVLVSHKGGHGLPMPRLIEKAENLKLLQTFAQSTEYFNAKSMNEKGITVSFAGGLTAISVAEHTILLMLAVLKRLRTSMNIVWRVRCVTGLDTPNTRRLHSKNVGIVGFGNIGRWVARQVNGFGANAFFYDQFLIPESVISETGATGVTLDELLEKSDIVSLHVPLTEGTMGMIGENQFNMMKPSAILINTCRGGVVDEQALINALETGRIAGAGLDVLAKEPPDTDNPLLHMENAVVTPHIASEVWEDYILLIELTWDNVTRLAEGRELRNVVTPDTAD